MDIFADMRKDKLGMPTLPEEGVPSAEETFESMSWEDPWTESGVTSVCHWLRGGTHLSVPATFRSLLPKRL